MVVGGMESMLNVLFLVGRDLLKYGGYVMEVSSYGKKIVSIM